MSTEYTSQPQKVLPTAAAGVSITPSATAWASSSWVQITASLGVAIVLVGIAVRAGVAAEFEVDAGTGGAGSETVVATMRGNVTSLGFMHPPLLFPVPIDNVPASTRIAVRLRKVGTSTVAWAASTVYYEKPL